MLDLIQTRRDLHQIPEIGLEEFKTQAYLLDVIEKLTAGKNFVQVRTWRTGILVYCREVSQSGLLVGEQILMVCRSSSKQAFLSSSQHQGRMHACGHDFHMTIALGCLERALEEQTKEQSALSVSAC